MTQVISIKRKFNMKKIVLASLLTLAVGSAVAGELGVQGLRDFSGQDRNGFGISYGQKVGSVTATAGFERFTKGSNDLDRYTLVGGYDVTKIGPVTLTAKAGVAYLDPQTTANGWAGLVGAGVSYPLNKTVAITADYRYQTALQTRVDSFNGSTVSAGLKVSF